MRPVENAPQAEHMRFLFDPRATLTTFAAQRRRLASTAAELSDEELASPSRCAGWSVADVLRHLVWVDLTMRRIWSGDESIAEGFDPRITPDEAVRDDRVIPDEAIRERYLRSTEGMVTDLEGSDPQRFGRPSLSPAGLVPWWMSAVHAGWDSSIHERDVLLPLGRRFEPVDDETEVCLAYSLLLTSFFAGRDSLSLRIGTIELCREDGPVVVRAVTRPDEGDLGSEMPAVSAEDPVGAIDCISGRRPIEDTFEGDASLIYRIGGLSRYFTSPPT